MQLLSLLIALAVAGLYQLRTVRRWALPWENRLRAATRHPARGWVAVAALSLVVNFSIALHAGVPEPRVHDEFSNLLAADTFAHGRLTNPTHPLWPFFVTFYELQHPSYMSKYPPAQGLVLACGEMIDGLPIVGVWLATAALCASVGWALAAFVPPIWSVVGAALVVVHPLIGQWSQIYWGGSVAGVGGALVLGGCGRLAVGHRGRSSAAAAIALGVGLGILALSRPYEGAALSLMATGVLVLRRRWRGLLVALLAAAPLMAWLGYYNHRVVGSAVQLPYLVYERQYAIAPPFLWQPLRTPTELAREPATMRLYAQGVEVPHFLEQQSLRGFLAGAAVKIGNLARATASPWIIGLLAIAAPLAVAADRRLWIAVAATAVVVAATVGSNWTRPQYVAPAVAAVVVLLTAGLAQIARRWPALARGVAAGIFIASTGVTWIERGSGAGPTQRGVFRAALEQDGAQNLVFVHFLPGHPVNDEWVFNSADIDAQAVVWARDLGMARNVELLRYFARRQAWEADVGEMQAVLRRYPGKP